ncbi:DUF4113 domain-containing protein [Pseudomonas veronii]
MNKSVPFSPHRWGRGTLRSARVPKNADWAMRREMMSPS